MSNKYLASEKSQLLHNRLEKLADKLVRARNLDDMATNEQVIAETIRSLNSLYKDLTAPTFSPEKIIEADLPDPSYYNSFFQTLLDDLTIIFTELENVEALSVSNFNFASVEANKLFARLKNVSSKLGDYILYSENTSDVGLFFTDSFNNVSRIDTGSALLNDLECNINQEEGIITLPINKNKTVLVNITQTPVIDEANSNGEVGNNYQLNSSGLAVPKRNDVNVILDDNPDTWFEYERVEAEDTGEALRLDLTINLGETQVVNHVVVNPNNFGTRTAIKIVDILTSLDGREESETSIKDDIPIAGLAQEDEENIFLLAPSTSKYAGKGIYTFTPRKVKYVRFIFEQTEPYVIKTENDSQFRYAIGIRDINIYSLVFEPKGELISSAFQSVNEVKKAILDVAQNPSSYSELAAIQYYLSPNNGQSWHEIQPRDFLGRSGVVSEVPEILNFNTVDEGAISTPSPVRTIKLKSVLSRTDENFTEEKAVSFQQTSEFTTELHRIPVEQPFSFDLSEVPVEGSVAVSQPFTGSRGKSSTHHELRGFELEDSGAGTQSYSLFGAVAEEDQPIIKRPNKKSSSGSDPVVYSTGSPDISDFFHVYVAGEEWSQATQSLDSYSDTTSKVFNLDLHTATLSFGNGQTSASPPENAYIGVYLDAEKLFFEKVGDDYFTTLNFKTGLDKESLSIERFHPTTSTIEILAKGSREVHLENKNITDTSGIESALSGTKQTFLNGNEELSSDGHYSIDTKNGIIYFYTATDSDEDTVVTYSYQKIEKLSKEDWYWNDDFSGFFIRAKSFNTFKRDNLELPVDGNRKKLHLADLDISKDTLSFNSVLSDVEGFVPDDTNPFLEEVDYIDGVEEIYIEGQNTESVTETISDVSVEYYKSPFASAYSWGSYFITFTLGQSIEDSSYPVVFSNTDLFGSEDDRGRSFLSDGEYYIDRTAGTVLLRVGARDVPAPGGTEGVEVFDFGSITYFRNPLDVNTLGRYSVDYKNGIVYTDRPMDENWIVTSSYEYSDYRAHYNIAKEVPSASYILEGKTITINPNEILGRYAQPKQRTNLYYQVNYRYAKASRTDIPELKDYFTPVLKSYNLRMITDRDLF